MRRYFLHLAYNGTLYHGWQIQPNARSVQECLENALSLLTSAKIDIIGAGRTDTGVHASSFYAHFDTEIYWSLTDLENLVYKLNAILDKGISIFSIFAVDPQVHARFSAIARTYTYHIHTYKDPFVSDFSHFVPFTLDVEAMNTACDILREYTDFSCFSKTHTQTRTNFCKISRAEWARDANHLKFTITADRFLRNMVRAIVGTLLNVGYGKMTAEEIRKIIDSQNRSQAGVSVPAKALFLRNIEYPIECNILNQGVKLV